MLRIISMLTTAIALLYALEFTGVIPERAYFPSLPRLESAAANPAAWGAAAAWGTRVAACAGTGQAIATCRDAANTPGTEPAQQTGRFTDRVAAKQKPAA